jgi:glycine cleavage system H protein
MPPFLEFTVDKFTFKIASDRFYSPDGLWVKPDGATITVGLSDFLQQRSGDVAFADVVEAGTILTPGDELATIETIKSDIELPSPVSGTVVTVNPEMEGEPDIINSDPYGEGWLAVIEATNWPADRQELLDAQTYLAQAKAEALEEVG